MNSQQPFVIGVAGGSGSGKTTVSRRLCEAVGDGQLSYIQHDSYYHPYEERSIEERSQLNYDHPDSLDTDLMVEHIRQLRSGQSVQVPIYDFASYTRLSRTRVVEPTPIILVEGILLFVSATLRTLLDMRIFVDTDADLRFIRRMERDIHQRGRSLQSVTAQYLNTVRPMHMEFVEPSKRHAHIIVPRGGRNTVAMEMIISRIQAVLHESSTGQMNVQAS